MLQGGKLVAAVAPTTTLPQLGNQNELKNSHQKQHHENDSNTLPQLNKKAESYTRQSSYSTINTGTPDRTKRDAYGNKLPMTPGGRLADHGLIRPCSHCPNTHHPVFFEIQVLLENVSI